MNLVFGKMLLAVAVPVQSEMDYMGLLEANYKLKPNRIVTYKLVAVDAKGVEHEINVNNLEQQELEAYVAWDE